MVKTGGHKYLVSAIVSTYNAEKFIRGCLEDLESQTIVDHLEIIVVDSGSQENEQAIVKEFQQRYNNIVYIRTKERETIYTAWNRGIKAACGKYITNANTDDRHRSDAFESMVELLETHPEIVLVYADSAITDKENETFESAHVVGHFRWPEFDPRLLFQVCYVGPQPMWRRELHQRYGYFDERYRSAGDYEFWLRIAGNERFLQVPEVLGLYLMSPTGVEYKNQALSYKESERARNRYWPAARGKRPSPGGHFVIPVHPSIAGQASEAQRPLFSAINPADENYSKPEPMISVIMPTYNRPDMLVEAVNSILRQTYKNFEIIIVSDGGEDISNVIAPYKDRCKIIYIKPDERKGPAGARNCGLQKAKGKYIAYLDDDDVYYPNHLDTLAGFLEKSDYKVAYSDSYQAFQRWDGNKFVTVNKKLAYGQNFDKERLLIKNFIPTLNVVHRRDCIEEVGLFDEELKTQEDWDLWIRMSKQFDFYHLKTITAEFRTRSESTSCTSSNRPDFLMTMKVIHSRYSHLATDPDIIKHQKNVEDALEKEIYSKEKISLSPINLSKHIDFVESKISIIIPVRNGGEGIKKLLNKIRSQRKVQDIEIIVIDSESTDDSATTAKEFGAKVIHISQSEFNHGSVRNLGASEARGDYLVFTVQDATPVSNYWLYNMICPFIEYPELAALSSKQFVKPEADLFSLWGNKKITPYDSNCMWSLLENLKSTGWKDFDYTIKGGLMHFDNVSSCIKRSTFDKVQFSPFMFGEDMDFGKKLLERRKSIGYITSTGVYHWHERGADYIFKRFYIGTKGTLYILENDLPYFFNKNNINLESLAINIIGTYDLINISTAELGDIVPEPIIVVRSFVNYLKRNMEISPEKIKKTLKEREIQSDNGLDLLLRQVIGDSAFAPEQIYNFRRNFLIPGFMDYFGQFSEYLCSKHNTLKGREKDFVSCIYKIFAMAAGEALSAYYLEAKSLNSLTPDLKRIDQLLARNICYF